MDNGISLAPSSMMVARRVMIVGGSGSGKSYLALKLSERGRLPSYHMDQLSWRPGFLHRTTAEMNELTRGIHAREHWILEGGHYETSHERANKADLLIWMDLNPALQSWRVLLRSLRYHGKVRPCMAEGCPERFGRHTINVVRYVWDSRQFHQKQIQEVIANAPPGLKICRLQTPRQVRQFLSKCLMAPDAPGVLISERI